MRLSLLAAVVCAAIASGAGVASTQGFADVRPTFSGTAPPPGIDLRWPSNPGAPGTFFANCSQEDSARNAQFSELDFDKHQPGALGFVADPGGSGRSVARFRIAGNDNADCTGAASGNRNEVYESKERFGGGVEVWQIYGIRVDETDFSSNFMQMHSPHGCGPPPIDASIAGTDLTVSVKLAPGAPRIEHRVGPAPRGQWLALALHVRYTTTKTGYFEAWSGVNTFPDTSQPPAAARRTYPTIYTGACGSSRGFDKIGIYGSGGNVETLFLCGYGRDSSLADARDFITRRCPLAAPPPGT